MGRKISYIFIYIFMFLAIVPLLACGPKVVPIAVKGAVINEKRGAISIEKGGVTVTAEATLLSRTPYNLEKYFTPFSVVVRNETGREITIDYDDFILLDEKGNQYRAYSPDKMAEIVKSDPEYVLRPPVVAVPLTTYTSVESPYPYGYTNYPYGTPYYDPNLRQWVYPPQLSTRERREFAGEMLLQDIFLTSLPVGKVVDGAQVSGNVYFRVNLKKVKSAKVRVNVGGVLFELPFLVR